MKSAPETKPIVVLGGTGRAEYARATAATGVWEAER